MSYDESHWDDAVRIERDFDREPSPLGCRPRQLDPRGSVKRRFVCSEAEHEAMKRDGRFDAMKPCRREFLLVDFEDGSPQELHRYANCPCTSTLVKVVATSDAPEWLQILREAGLI